MRNYKNPQRYKNGDNLPFLMTLSFVNKNESLYGGNL